MLERDGGKCEYKSYYLSWLGMTAYEVNTVGIARLNITIKTYLGVS